MKILETKKMEKHKLILTSIAYIMLSTLQLSASDPLKELNEELAAVHLHYKAHQLQKTSKVVYQAGKYVKYVGQGVSLIGALDLDPYSAPIVQAVRIGLTISGVVLQKGVSPILENHALTLKDKALRKSAPLSISEFTAKEIDELADNREKLNKKLIKAVASTWYRKASDKLRLSHPTKRSVKAHAKYDKLINEVDQKCDRLLEVKRGISNIVEYLDHKSVLHPLTQQEEELKAHNVNYLLLEVDKLHEVIGYLLSYVGQAKNPQIYKALIKGKERKFIRLQNTH